jgi:predicted MFS family arabinose efflux permease
LTAARRTLAATMLVSLMGTAGIALPYPVLAPFFTEANNNNAMTAFLGLPPEILLGILLALYPLGLLIGSAFIGALSDVAGRKRVLVTSLTLAAVAYLITGVAVLMESYLLFACGRLLTGLCEGNMAISRAIALDLHPVIDRTRAMSLVYATTYGGWMLGPVAGGYLAPLGIHAVFLVAAAVSLLVVLIVWRALDPDTPTESTNVWTVLARNNSLTLLRFDDVRRALIFQFVFTLGVNAFFNFYPLWLTQAMDAQPQDIAWATVLLTIGMIGSSVWLVTRLNHSLGTFATIALGGSMTGVTLACLPWLGLISLPLAMALVGIGIAISNGVFPTWVTTRLGHHGHGRMMGLLTTTFCASSMVVSLIGGVISMLGAATVLLVGALAIGLSLLWFIVQLAPVESRHARAAA